MIDLYLLLIEGNRYSIVIFFILWFLLAKNFPPNSNIKMSNAFLLSFLQEYGVYKVVRQNNLHLHFVWKNIYVAWASNFGKQPLAFEYGGE